MRQAVENPTRPGLWLHATDPDLTPALAVLAEQAAALDGALTMTVTGPDSSVSDARAVDAFLREHAVRMVVLAGQVLPVALIARACAQGVALVLVEATHPVAPDGWRFIPGRTRSLLSRFAQIYARDAASATVFKRLVRGRVDVFTPGPLARFAPVAGCNAIELDAMRAGLGTRPVWFAYDLPMSEVDAALLAHAQALRRAHRLLLILRPRDPGDGADLAARGRELGFACARRALDEEIDETTQVYLADAEDDPGLFLRLAPVSFLGGSLTPGADQPAAIIAAALGSALIFGPCARGEQRAFLDRLRDLGGGRQIGVASAALGEALAALLAPDQGAEAALRAWSVASEGSDATNFVARCLVDWLQLNVVRG